MGSGSGSGVRVLHPTVGHRTGGDSGLYRGRLSLPKRDVNLDSWYETPRYRRGVEIFKSLRGSQSNIRLVRDASGQRQVIDR
jgi:hypothetical protein